MGKINVLSSKIFNRISAGEVVERPASVIKELVENSIDAGATEITIEVVDGGITSMVVSDNGQGIERSDLKKAVLPHATSKISKISDLDCITSLGFRGEALASIASVSKLTIKSKTKEQEIGAELYCEGGLIQSLNESGATNGTEIIVNNLFYNTPVRAKFLKTIKGEESEITTLITRFILGNPNLSIKYVVDGKIKLQSFGDGLESAFVSIYGVQAVKDCFFIDTIKNGIQIKGYIGKHHFTKPNRNYQTVFLNNRFIINQTIASAISNSYSSYLMKRQYPFYSLSISVPFEIVDVNVHPNKIDVRFANNQIIYGSIYSVISKVLDGSSEALNIVLSDNIKTDNRQVNTNDILNDYASHNQEKMPKGKLVFNDNIAKSLEFNRDSFDNKLKDNVVDIFAENKAYILELEKKKQLKQEQAVILPKVENEINEPISSVEQSSIDIKTSLTYVGQAFNTYLIYEDASNMYFIDQHAAHERI